MFTFYLGARGVTFKSYIRQPSREFTFANSRVAKKPRRERENCGILYKSSDSVLWLDLDYDVSVGTEGGKIRDVIWCSGELKGIHRRRDPIGRIEALIWHRKLKEINHFQRICTVLDLKY